LKKKDITLLIYSITCSMYDYLAWIEVLRVVVSVLHLRVILQYRSSDSSSTFDMAAIRHSMSTERRIPESECPAFRSGSLQVTFRDWL